jgi:hypothetical protein
MEWGATSSGIGGESLCILKRVNWFYSLLFLKDYKKASKKVLFVICVSCNCVSRTGNHGLFSRQWKLRIGEKISHTVHSQLESFTNFAGFQFIGNKGLDLLGGLKFVQESFDFLPRCT